jgi:nucleoid-associated protein YgaU
MSQTTGKSDREYYRDHRIRARELLGQIERSNRRRLFLFSAATFLVSVMLLAVILYGGNLNSHNSDIQEMQAEITMLEKENQALQNQLQGLKAEVANFAVSDTAETESIQTAEQKVQEQTTQQNTTNSRSVQRNEAHQNAVNQTQQTADNKPDDAQNETASETVTADDNGLFHTVEEDDHLWGIAVRYFGNGFLYHELMKMNDLDSPDDIYTGQKLLIKVENNE